MRNELSAPGGMGVGVQSFLSIHSFSIVTSQEYAEHDARFWGPRGEQARQGLRLCELCWGDKEECVNANQFAEPARGRRKCLRGTEGSLHPERVRDTSEVL